MHTEMEKRLLRLFAMGILGGTDEHCGAKAEAWDAIESLKAKGLLCRALSSDRTVVWILSAAGHTAAREADGIKPS